jgi:DNA-binding NtrC family response regulator
LLTAIRQFHPDILTIIITAHGTIEMAVEAMKRGASDFIMKPFHVKTLSSVIRVANERVAAKRRASITAASSDNRAAAASEFIVTSAVMLKLLDQVKTIAPFNTTVLVTGETGTGKELVARQIHLQSLRRAHPFVAFELRRRAGTATRR